MGLIARSSISQNEKLQKIYPSFLDTTNSNFLLMDNMYISSFLVVDYNNEMEGGFFDLLLASGIDLNVSIYYEKQDFNEIIKKITYQLGNTGSDIKNSNENQMDMDVMSKTYQDAKYIRKQMQLEKEDFYYLYIYISIYSNSKKKLEINMKRIENIASSIGLTLLRANFKQEDCFLASLPFLKNHDLLKKISHRNVLSDGITSTYPFLSSELCDEDGVFIGTSEYSHSLVMMNRFDSEKYKNANMFIIRHKWFG